MNLSRPTRLALKFGIKTKEYQQVEQQKAKQAAQEKRREAFLTRPREQVLNDYPEMKPIYEVQDSALSFFNDVLIATPTSLNTNRRNHLRAQLIAYEAFDFLDHEKPIPSFSRVGRHQEASQIRAEELRTLRHELNTSFEENARVNVTLREQAFARYATLSSAFFTDEVQAVKNYPELNQIVTVKKQAKRYYSQWIVEDKVDLAIKDCLHRALKDLSRQIPLAIAEEIKEEAESLRSSWIGTQSNVPQLPKSQQTSKRKPYHYQSINYLHELIGKNGIAQGWWPYEPDHLEVVNRINRIDKEILKEQWQTSFYTQPKADVVKRFPALNVLYHKLDAATAFYQEKIASPYAQVAAKALVHKDFDKLLNNEPLQAVSEIDSEIHEQILRAVKYQLQIEGKTPSLIEKAKPFQQLLHRVKDLQETQFHHLDAANDLSLDETAPILIPSAIELTPKKEVTLASIATQLKALKEQFIRQGLSLAPLEKLIQEYLPSQTLQATPTNALPFQETERLPSLKEESPIIAFDKLRSTAQPLVLDSLLNSSHLSKTVQREKANHWDMELLTNVLKEKADEFAIHLLGEPIRREANQLRFGSNKGSLVVTIKGSKQGLWYEHQTGEGGNLIQLVQKEKNLTFKEALDFVGNYLNLAPELVEKSVIDVSDLPEGMTESEINSIRYARELANGSQPLQGSLAERYLKNRGIDPSLCSAFVRFLPRVKESETGQYHPALLLIGKNLTGLIQCAQVTYLTPEGKKLSCENPKRTYGHPKGALVPVRIGKSNLYGLAKGGETSLSVACAYPDLTVFAALGSFSNFAAVPFDGKGNTLIAFLDHDDAKNPSLEKGKKAFNELVEKKFNVLTCKPNELGKDFNDVLQEKGVKGVLDESMKLRLYLVEQPPFSSSFDKERQWQITKKREPEHELDF